ncbi:hypothetical protein [Streptomyces sp. NRRL WC-3744]|uniref:hypothetical protein n=1 Tax=Streptomyces sp. NRRL WC-3744 TaxID=1463935 RepID=UPI000A71D409|nr:hypothetical protein [Streptomyces sp. NRRL WC-3744]
MPSSFPEIGDLPEVLAAVASLRLDDEQLARAAGYAKREEVAAGQVLFDTGDESAGKGGAAPGAAQEGDHKDSTSPEEAEGAVAV